VGSALYSVSALKTLAVPGKVVGKGGGVLLLERHGLSLATVMARMGKLDELGRVLERDFGIQLPEAGRRTGTEKLSFAWSAPGQWLACAEGVERVAFERRLRDGLKLLASVSNQSDGRTVIRISGDRSRDVLAKGVPLDLHPSVFTPGCTASTIVAHINVHFWQLDDRPSYEFAVFRSFSAAFWHFLTESSAEYGYTVS
jgi:methylglutamate dehydrogenase subunit D